MEPGGVTLPEIPDSDGRVIGYAAGIAIVRMKRGILTKEEMQDALEEAYRMGQRSMKPKHIGSCRVFYPERRCTCGAKK